MINPEQPMTRDDLAVYAAFLYGKQWRTAISETLRLEWTDLLAETHGNERVPDDLAHRVRTLVKARMSADLYKADPLHKIQGSAA